MKGHFPLLILLAAGLAWAGYRGGTSGGSTCAACIPAPGELVAPLTLSSVTFTPQPLAQDPLPTLLQSLSPMSNQPSVPVLQPLTLPYAAPPEPAEWQNKAAADRLADVCGRVLPQLHRELSVRQIRPGARVFMRGFKETRELEVWLRTGQDAGADWVLFRTYPVHALSGEPGPKFREGDGQTPEGVYSVHAGAMNPASLFHLSFNVGYPNEFDRHHNRTGSAIMVHGSNVSIGCLAMSDPVIEEIYLLVQEALDHGQERVPIHLFPFRMTEARMARVTDSPHLAFWQDLKPIYDHFEAHRVVPTVRVVEGRYALSKGRG